MTAPPLYLDATMLYRWRELAPVGIVRLERTLAAHLRFQSAIGPAQFVVWDRGYRAATASEIEILDEVLRGTLARETAAAGGSERVGTPTDTTFARGIRPTLRRTGLRLLARTPEHLRPFAEQAAWSAATFAVESVRYARRSRERRKAGLGRSDSGRREVLHQVDLTNADLVALGLGWEYLDHEAMYRLKRDRGTRIHMPAFDLIPVIAPHLNVGQSDMVHRYYAEMAHYADSITCISESTADALRRFIDDEELPVPLIAVNTLPGFELTPTEHHTDARPRRRHRFHGERFVLSVSTVEVRKNHLLLAKIWAECIAEGIDIPRLVIVGRIGWDVDEVLRWVAHAPGTSDRVSIVSDVDDDELASLYDDAMFTVFPSRLEGWGLPITESLTHGKVCVHATDPAQYEASQGLMPAFHPDDYVSWKREIVRLSTDSEYRVQLEQTIDERYVRLTPEEYCRQFEAILASRRSGS